ncbi:MAG TPA: NAD-dependent epimerase/dehydratase family protein [Cytophagales bacterium]|jgi:CDP-paratose 2-epimerase
MKILITGICGFVGSSLAAFFSQHAEGVELVGIDNLSRRGSESNLAALKALGCRFIHGDIRAREDVDELPAVDWIIDCAANPSVLAGVNGGTAQLISHNLNGTLHLLEKCRRDKSGFVLLSTSRVYSIEALNQVPLRAAGGRFEVDSAREKPTGFSEAGVTESFPTSAPISLYGATKLASEVMALEYAATFDFPVWINRCGVIAGPGQFGRIDQGVFSFWIYQWLLGKPLSFIGFDGSGRQVRDFFSPADLGDLLLRQLRSGMGKGPRLYNVGGGAQSALSLQELNAFCADRFGFPKEIIRNASPRPFDIPYYVTDYSLAAQHWGWAPKTDKYALLDQMYTWAVQHKKVIESWS